MSYLPARATDPATSWEAAEKMVSSGKAAAQRAIAVAAVQNHPGLTSFELSRVCRLERHQIARRLPECPELVKGAARKCNVTGHQAVTWWPASQAAAA
jgi:hypothetical protein